MEVKPKIYRWCGVWRCDIPIFIYYASGFGPSIFDAYDMAVAALGRVKKMSDPNGP